MGNAFMKSYNDTIERNRRQEIEDEDRAWKREQREALRQELADKKQLKQDLSDASAPRTTMTGVVTKSDAGQVFSATQENAKAMQDTLAAEAELREGAAPTQQAGYAITGSMSKGHQIATGAVPEGSADTPDARNERMLNAYRKNGQWDKAVTMENTLLDQKSKLMGLQKDEWAYLDEQANRELQELVPFSPTWLQDAARFFTNNQSGPFKGMNVQAVLSEDGKTADMVAQRPSGEKWVVQTLQNNKEGHEKFMEGFQKVAPSVKFAALKDARKQAQERADKERELKMKEEEAGAAVKLKNAQAAYYGAAAGAKDAGAQNTAGKLSGPDEIALNAIVDERKAINKALIEAEASGSESAIGLQAKLAALFVKEQQILGRYQQPSASRADPRSGSRPDPLGKLGSSAAPSTGAPSATAVQPGAPASTRVAPQVQAARDSDAKAILQGELAQAQQRLAAGDPRAQADIEALQRELRAQGVPVSGTAMQEAVAPAPQAQPAAAAKPLVTMEAARKVDPLYGKSQQQIREIKAELQRERKRWAGEPNAGKRIAEIDALLNRIENGRY